jgi:hypothetical protein
MGVYKVKGILEKIKCLLLATAATRPRMRK